MDNQDTQEFKHAAQRLQEHLKPHGIRLKQGVALEALSASFGDFDWRTVHSKLQGTTQAPRAGESEPLSRQYLREQVQKQMQPVYAALREHSAHKASLPLEGYAQERVQSDPQRNALEAAYARAWKDAQHPGQDSLLRDLVPNCTADQARAMATVVQWLGSEVGNHFVQEVLRSQGWRVQEPHKGPRWLVNGVYVDNGQRWGDYFNGSTPLEAQLMAQMERLADEGSATAIEVTSVQDMLTGQLADEEAFTGDVEPLPFLQALTKVVSLAREHLPKAPQRGVQAADAWDELNASVEFWEAVADGAHRPGAANDVCVALGNLLHDGLGFALHDVAAGDVSFIDSRGVEMSLTASESLEQLLQLAERGIDLTDTSQAKQTGVFQILQLRAFLAHFEDGLDSALDGTQLEAV